MQILSDLMIYKPCGLMIYHNKLWMICKPIGLICLLCKHDVGTGVPDGPPEKV